MLQTRKDLKLITYDSFEKGLFDLLAGNIDAFCGPVPTFLELATDAHVDDRITIAGKPVTESKRSIGVRKDKPNWSNVSIKLYVVLSDPPNIRRSIQNGTGNPNPFSLYQRKCSGTPQ